MNTETAEYFGGGTITDKENVLTSNRGYYFSKSKMVFFKDSVVLTNPKYYIYADTLKYHTVSKIAGFEGPTHIVSTGADSARIYCEQGWYNTVEGKSSFNKNAWIISKTNKLSGDSLVYDDKTKVGYGYGNVAISDSVQKVTITGDYGYNNDVSKDAWVTGRAILVKAFDKDSLFMHADSLYAKQDTISLTRTWMAYKGVRIFKSDLQGKCDSLVYTTADSTLSFYNEPVLWSEQNQLTAVFMNMQMANGEINELRLKDAAFIISSEDSIRLVPIGLKAENMIGYFENDDLNSISVEGNGQSIYYTRNSKKLLTGVKTAYISIC